MGVSVSPRLVRDFRPNSLRAETSTAAAAAGDSGCSARGPKTRGPPPDIGLVALYNAIIQISSQSKSVAAMRPGHVLPRVGLL